MSGGHFDYIQHRVGDAYEEVKQIVKDKGIRGEEYQGDGVYKDTFTPLSAQTVQRMSRAKYILFAASKMLQRIDWFLSDDDGEDCFNRRWEEEGLDI